MDIIDFTLHFFSPPIQGKFWFLVQERHMSPNRVVAMVEDEVNNVSWPIYEPKLKKAKEVRKIA